MRSALSALVVMILTGCGLNPKQMEAIDGAMCAKIYGTTTVIVGGASKGGGLAVNGENCSIVSQGSSK